MGMLRGDLVQKMLFLSSRSNSHRVFMCGDLQLQDFFFFSERMIISGILVHMVVFGC